MCVDVERIKQILEEKDSPKEIIGEIRQQGITPTLSSKLGGREGNSRKGGPLTEQKIERIVRLGTGKDISNGIFADEL